MMISSFGDGEIRTDASMEGIEAADLSIREKIRKARSLYRDYKAILLEHPQIRDLLERLDRSLETSREVMFRGGVVAACRWCEEEAGGSCCGAGIENRYTIHLLLMNLLLGVSLPDRRAWTDSCYFLGEAGCCLQARHVLCVNYLCEKLRRDLDPGVLQDLQQSSGTELDTGFVLHEALKKITGA